MEFHVKFIQSIALCATSILFMQGCQSTAIESVKSSWEEAKQRNAEKKAKWYYNNKPLMALKHRSGKEFNIGGKKDTIDGFRDFKWSSSLPENMKLVKRDGLLSYYQYEGEVKKRIGGANLSDIHFSYFDGRLHSVVLLTDNDTDGQALLSALDMTFGRGIAPDFSSQKPWSGKYTLYNSPFFVHDNLFHYNKHYGWAEYDCLEESKPCQATIYSKIEEYKLQEALINQAENASSDF